MASQFCPRCEVVRDMVVTIYKVNKKVEEGKIVRIVTSYYHCLTCNAFVYTEDNKYL
jgi:hypothetical protein